jgi:hypothetical protein
MTESMRLAREGGILTREGEVFFDKLDPHPLAGQGLDNPAKVVEVAGQPVHAVDQGQRMKDFGPLYRTRRPV